MIISGNEIVRRGIITPASERALHAESGMTFGAGPAGYDVRIAQNINLAPNGREGSFSLASTVERFAIPKELMGFVHDKSSLIRRGLYVGNTVLEAGWMGWLTLELANLGPETIELKAGQPIAQVIFHMVYNPETVYDGKYQNQENRPVPAIFGKPGDRI